MKLSFAIFLTGPEFIIYVFFLFNLFSTQVNYQQLLIVAALNTIQIILATKEAKKRGRRPVQLSLLGFYEI